MSTMSAIIARIGADIGGLRKGLEEARKVTESEQQKMTAEAKRAMKEREAAQRESSARIKEAAGEVAGLAGIPLGIAGIAEAGREVVEFASELQDTSDAIGINVEALQELQYAFGQSGTKSEVFRKGLTKLSQNQIEAREGNEKLIASFADLGVTWGDLHQLAPDEILMKVAGSADEAGDPAERLAKIMDVLGKAGAPMAAGLNSGAEAIRSLREEASKLTKEEVATLDNAGDMLATFGRQAKVSAGKFLIEELGPKIDATKKEIEGIASLAERAVEAVKKLRPGANLPDIAQPDPATNPLLTAADRAQIAPPKVEPERSSVPQSPHARKMIEDDAKAAIDALNSERNAQWSIGEVTADSDQKHKDESQQIDRLNREADNGRIASAAKLAGETSKRVQMEQESALLNKRVADAKKDLGNESDDVKRAEIAKQISDFGNEQRLAARERVKLEVQIAKAGNEVADAEERAAIEELKSQGAAGQRAALEREVQLHTRQIASNLREMATSDELRTAELKKQNAELAGQIAAVRAIQREHFIADKSDPNAAREGKREERRRAHLGERFERELALRLRNGKSAKDVADAEQPPLAERVKARGIHADTPHLRIPEVPTRDHIQHGLEKHVPEPKEPLNYTPILTEIKAALDKIDVGRTRAKQG